MSLSGQTAIVTGAAVRVGAAIAEALHTRGAQICLHCHRHAAQAEELAAAWSKRGPKATVVQADLAAPERAAREIVTHCASTLGPPTLLVNSASLFSASRLEDASEADWLLHYAINVVAPALLSREFAGVPFSGGRRQVINVLDACVDRFAGSHIAYATSKAALAILTRTLAVELAPGIRVNGVALGAILPPKDHPDEHQRRAAQSIPLRRTGSPTDVVEAVLYLAAADFVTGAILEIAGGEHLGGKVVMFR